MRVVIAGIVSGIALFIWLSIAHILTPLGMIGIKEIPNESVVLGAMKANIPESGLYFFPWMDPKAPAAEKKAAEERYQAGPYGILIYHPNGTIPISPRHLLQELLSNIVLGLLAMYLLSRTSGLSYGGRVAFAAAIGVIAAISTNFSYWNWYGFPANYTHAAMFTIFVGYIVMGLVGAAILRPKALAAK